MRQRTNEPEFEIECECIDPAAYLAAHRYVYSLQSATIGHSSASFQIVLSIF